MHIPVWFKFGRNKKTRASTSPIVPEIIGPPLDSIPPHHQNLVTRADWGADPPFRPKPTLHHPIKWMKLTFTTNTLRCVNLIDCIKIVRDLQLQHINIAGIDDIQYNFMIGGDGKVYEGRGWHLAPENELALLEPWQDKFIDIAFIGDDKGYKVPPSQAMFKAAWQLIQYGIEHKFISEHYKVL